MESSATAWVFARVVRRASALSPKLIIFRSKDTRLMVRVRLRYRQNDCNRGRVNQLTGWQMCGITYPTICLLIIFDADRSGLRQFKIQDGCQVFMELLVCIPSNRKFILMTPCVASVTLFFHLSTPSSILQERTNTAFRTQDTNISRLKKNYLQ
jgi:hypothetical protein